MRMRNFVGHNLTEQFDVIYLAIKEIMNLSLLVYCKEKKKGLDCFKAVSIGL